MRTRIPWVLLAFGAFLVVPILWLTIRNGSLEEAGPFIVVAIVVTTGWTTVGAMLASRNPSNPIGWLMMSFGVGFAVTGLADEWATYTYATEPGSLPLGAFFVWLANWFFVAVAATVPIMLLLYPTGRVPSRRWLQIQTAPGRGTTISATIPIEAVASPEARDPA